MAESKDRIAAHLTTTAPRNHIIKRRELRKGYCLAVVEGDFGTDRS
jgi:hypothetical protein